MDNKPYDVVTSLGYNCEVSFRIEDYIGKIASLPFSWSYTNDRTFFASAIENIEDLFTGDVSVAENHMFLCEKYKIKFHPRYAIFPQYGEYTEQQRKEALDELRSRIEHLKKNFIELCESDKKTLFIMKVEDKGDEDNSNYILSVEEALLKRYHSGNFNLCIVMLKGHAGAKVHEILSDRIKLFEVKKFAPQKHTNILGDIIGWNRLFKKMLGKSDKGYFISVWKRRLVWGIEVIGRKLHAKTK